ncbi:C1QL [Mytilus coruscus]|uniref:C1QL n=1 Tax=Mytilus coruscus TaxID=42192 RepID=A0A6J8AQ97_MYTCO|nr:C1QL [Mytilus coruscus]
MCESVVWLLFGLVIAFISFVHVEYKVNTVKDELEKVYINKINAVKDEMNDIEGRFIKDVNKVEDDMKLLMLEMKKEFTNNLNAVKDKTKETVSQFHQEVTILRRNIQVFSIEADKKITGIEILIDEKENIYKKEMSDVREEMFITLMKNDISLSTMRAEFKLSLQKTNNRCMNSINRMKTEIRPAFSATFTNERAIPLTHGEILKFDNVHLNIGEGYDPATGYFTVPKAGIYFVSSTIRSIENKHIHAFLWKNSEKLVLAYGRNWNTGSFCFPIDLQKGDLLFVKHDDGLYIVNEEVHGGSASFFAATFINNLHSG